jgi:DnaJ-class molecular chaperone
MQVRITGEGSAGTNGGPAGNLYVQVRVQDHPLFWREDFDLMHRIEINVAEASLGVTKPIPTLEGEPVDLEIPAGTQSGSYFRVRGLGVPHLRRNGRPTDRRGDIRVMVDIDVPTKLNKYQRKLLEDLEYSFSNGGKAPPKPRRSSAKGKASPSSEIDEETPVSATEDDGLGDEVSVESVESEEKQRGLFDRIKGTFSPNPDD